jgi:HPt (histidine-containing phosphotransfer) domain-containing protein
MAIRFRNEHAAGTRLIRDARAAGRIDEAVMTAHRIKGAAAHLGFVEASRLAAIVESALRDGHGDVSRLLKNLEQDLTPILTILARLPCPFATTGAGSAPDGSLDTALAVSLAQEILTAMDHNYALAAKKVAALPAMPLPRDLVSLSRRIVKHVDEYEPDEARPLLERLIAKLQRGEAA